MNLVMGVRMHRFRSVTIALTGILLCYGSAMAGEKTDAKAVKVSPIKTANGEKFSEVKPAAKNIREKYVDIRNAPVNLASTAQVGEKLTYLVRWKGIPAGTITLRVKRTKRIGDRKAMTLEMRVESNDFLSVIYPVQSTITSLADIETGQSYLFRRNLSEGRSRRVNDRLQFDYDYSTTDGTQEPVAIYSKVKDGETQTKSPQPIPGPLQDSLSVVYYMRHLDFEDEGDAHQVLIGSRKRVDVVSITARKFEQRKIDNFGTFDCVVVEPEGDEEADRTNIVSTEGKAMIWMEKHTGVPLHLQVKVPFGLATATLIEAEKADLDKHKVD